MMPLGEFWSAVTWWCHFFEGRVTAGPRCLADNVALHGVEHSPHLVGLGADVVYRRPPPIEARREWARRLGLVLVVNADYDHLQPVGWLAG